MEGMRTPAKKYELSIQVQILLEVRVLFYFSFFICSVFRMCRSSDGLSTYTLQSELPSIENKEE
jgi:hypothetical protein